MYTKRIVVLSLFLAALSLSSQAAKIQMAILLDGSGSMQGLIDQTKFQLSNIINELENATHQGQTPTLELALYEHGKSELTQEQGYLQKLSDLVTDPDLVNEKLFQITANGSEEYTGLAIQKAVDELNWSQDPSDFKVIFIAGNEPMQQGPVKFGDAIIYAKSKGIIVNTIYAGGADESDAAEWREAADLGAGEFANIDRSMNIETIPTKFDDAILNLNTKLNETYVQYGQEGAEGFGRMLGLDESMGEHLLARASTKAGRYYDSSAWDLVAAWEMKKVTINDAFDRSTLKEELRLLSNEQLIQYLDGMLLERKLLQKGIQSLSGLRNEYIRYAMAQNAGSALANVHQAIMATLKRQLGNAGFTL